jgi:hypothetical protein
VEITMFGLRSVQFFIGAAAAGALLSGCAGGASPTTVPAQGIAQSSALTSRASLSETSVRRDPPSASVWAPHVDGNMLAGGARVFATSASSNTIFIYSYATGKLLGSFSTGINEPQGLCNNKKSVWLANTADSNLVRYSAAGKVLGTLTDTGQYPVSCAVDKQGDIAAANILSTSGGPGSVSIWTGGSGSPVNYPVPGMSRVYFIGYDPNGDLFVDGSSGSGAFALAERAKGGSAFIALTLSGGTIGFPGGVQYADNALALGDQSGNGVIYQTHVSGSTATIVGTTDLNGAGDVAQFCITRYKTVIAPGDDGLELYAYPAGGAPIRAIGSGQGLLGCAILY